MQRKEFLEKTVIQLDDDLFGEFKKLIVGIYFIFLYKKRKHYQRNACRKTI